MCHVPWAPPAHGTWAGIAAVAGINSLFFVAFEIIHTTRTRTPNKATNPCCTSLQVAGREQHMSGRSPGFRFSVFAISIPRRRTHAGAVASSRLVRRDLRSVCFSSPHPPRHAHLFLGKDFDLLILLIMMLSGCGRKANHCFTSLDDCISVINGQDETCHEI